MDWVFIVGDPMIILDAILIVGIIVDRKRFLRDILADAVVWYYIWLFLWWDVVDVFFGLSTLEDE